MKNKIILCFLLSLVIIFGQTGCTKKNNNEIAFEEGLAMPKPGSALAEAELSVEKETGNNGETLAVEADEPLYNRVSFVGCGDNIIYYGNIRDAKSLSDGTREYNFKPMFERVKEKIANADIAFINQETVMAGEGYALSYYPRFNSPRDVGYDLVELGYDVINIANNHMLDKGAEGLERTIDFWNGMDCLMIGGYRNDKDYDTVRVLEKNGIKTAFLAYTFYTNGLSKGKDSELAIPYLDNDDIVRQTQLAGESADFIIASVHWGNEGAFLPNAEQKRVAQLLSDCGVDVILGHHPHVIQPVEWITGKNGNKTLCVYSLGNFAAEQAYAYNMVGGIIEFDIVSKDGGEPYVENPVFNPTVFHFDSGFYNNTVYFMQDYTSELAAEHGVRTYYKRSLTTEMLHSYVKKYISSEFLPKDLVFEN